MLLHFLFNNTLCYTYMILYEKYILYLHKTRILTNTICKSVLD